MVHKKVAWLRDPVRALNSFRSGVQRDTIKQSRPWVSLENYFDYRSEPLNICWRVKKVRGPFVFKPSLTLIRKVHSQRIRKY